MSLHADTSHQQVMTDYIKSTPAYQERLPLMQQSVRSVRSTDRLDYARLSDCRDHFGIKGENALEAASTAFIRIVRRRSPMDGEVHRLLQTAIRPRTPLAPTRTSLASHRKIQPFGMLNCCHFPMSLLPLISRTSNPSNRRLSRYLNLCANFGRQDSRYRLSPPSTQPRGPNSRPMSAECPGGVPVQRLLGKPKPTETLAQG